MNGVHIYIWIEIGIILRALLHGIPVPLDYQKNVDLSSYSKIPRSLVALRAEPPKAPSNIYPRVKVSGFFGEPGIRRSLGTRICCIKPLRKGYLGLSWGTSSTNLRIEPEINPKPRGSVYTSLLNGLDPKDKPLTSCYTLEKYAKLKWNLRRVAL